MGASCSGQAKDGRGAKSNKRQMAYHDSLATLGLSARQLEIMWDIYSAAYDADEDNVVTVGSLCRVMSMTRSAFFFKCMSIGDMNRTGQLEFPMFVVAVWNFCTIDLSSMAKFVFDLYDDNGLLDLAGMRQLLKETCAAPENKMQPDVLATEAILQAVDEKFKEGMQIAYACFADFIHQYPRVLFHPCDLQAQLRMAVLSRSNWEVIQYQRTRATNALLRFPQWRSLVAQVVGGSAVSDVVPFEPDAAPRGNIINWARTGTTPVKSAAGASAANDWARVRSPPNTPRRESSDAVRDVTGRDSRFEEDDGLDELVLDETNNRVVIPTPKAATRPQPIQHRNRVATASPPADVPIGATPSPRDLIGSVEQRPRKSSSHADAPAISSVIAAPTPQKAGLLQPLAITSTRMPRSSQT